MTQLVVIACEILGYKSGQQMQGTQADVLASKMNFVDDGEGPVISDAFHMGLEPACQGLWAVDGAASWSGCSQSWQERREAKRTALASAPLLLGLLLRQSRI